MTNLEPIVRFTETVEARLTDYGLDLSPQIVQSLAEYYALFTRWNQRLHLVAPCSAEEFATRHVLESLLLLRFLPEAPTVCDIGSGAGLPIIPCMIARPDLSATLIESSQKKSVFLREALNQIGISNRGTIIARPFEEVEPPAVTFVTCRALDEFISKVSALVKWAPGGSTLLLFGGEALRQKLETTGTRYTEFLMPLSERRFLFEVKKDP
jgi:16S rRNA (guanine527-N7)-methyltransferase